MFYGVCRCWVRHDASTVNNHRQFLLQSSSRSRHVRRAVWLRRRQVYLCSSVSLPHRQVRLARCQLRHGRRHPPRRRLWRRVQTAAGSCKSAPWVRESTAVSGTTDQLCRDGERDRRETSTKTGLDRVTGRHDHHQ